ncbi:MAG: hypothetical protein HY815_20400 [Candidatus Riflebacteria bacterium]|nr:hypothetical protein [Candidatus Riflebacteria bacterium]
MKNRPAAFTLIETIVGLVVGVLILGIAWTLWHSSRVQEKGVVRHIELQRGLRHSMAQIQKDLRAVREVVELERESSGTLKTLTMKVPADSAEGGLTSVIYTFDRSPEKPHGVFKRNSRVLFQETLIDFQIFPFTLDEGPREVKGTTGLDKIHLFKVKLTFVPAKDEFQRQAEQRSFSFTIYPRMLNSRRKALISRLNLLTNRFGQQPQTRSPSH